MGEPSVVVVHSDGGDHNTDQTHQDSLYHYISWEDPLRTLGTYLGSLGILFGAHYLPFTQWALKAGMTTLGVVSVTEFASRSFSSDSISTRLRPKKYKTVPESTLNATLKDVHDLIQSGAVQAQKIIYGQDLEKTFAAFIGFAAIYGLMQFLAPFWLAVLALTSVFIAPLFNSPQGRKVAHDATARAQEIANTTGEMGKDLAHTGQVKASELSSKAQQAAHDAGRTVSNTAQNGKQTAADVSARARDNASNLSGAAAQGTKNAGANVSNAAQGGQQTAADLSSKARDNTADASRYAGEQVGGLQQAGANALESARGSLGSVFGQAKQNLGGASDGNYTHESSRNVSHSEDRATGGDYSRGQSGVSSDGSSRNTHDYSHNVSHSGDRNNEGTYSRGQSGISNDGSVSNAAHSSHIVEAPVRLSAADEVNRRAV
ncbi:reticulon-like protein [Colletotrichum higginsianum]|nr:reticulon-like protein [Colletotrichum higginsianum]